MAKAQLHQLQSCWLYSLFVLPAYGASGWAGTAFIPPHLSSRPELSTGVHGQAEVKAKDLEDCSTSARLQRSSVGPLNNIAR